MSSTAAAQVESVVRRYLESQDPEAAGGLLREVEVSVHAAGLDAPSTTTIRSLTVVSVTDEDAHLELDAVQQFVVQGRWGREHRRSVSIAGPVHAHRERGHWKVVDHCLEGRRISESYFALHGHAVRADDVSLRLTSVLLLRNDVVAFVEVENHGAEQAKIASVTFVAKRCRCAGGRTRSVFEPGSSSTVALGWRKSLPRRIRALRLGMVMRTASGRHASATWRVDLHARRAEGSLREVGRLRAWLTSATASWVFAGAGFAAVVAMIGIPPLSFFVIPGLVMAYMLVHPLLQRR